MTDHNMNQITEGVKSMKFNDDDASKYFINYISDDSHGFTDNSNEHEYMNDNDIDASSLSNSLIIAPVPEDLFTSQQMKDEFEQLFRIYDSQITVLYLKSFQRVRITFTSAYNASQARLHLNQLRFHGTIINTYFTSPIIIHGTHPDVYLRPPEPEKLYLISPPASPPEEWQQKLENPPTVDLTLLAAIAQLQPNESHELMPREHHFNAPSITIQTCEDANDVEINQSLRQKLIKPSFVPTKRPSHQADNRHS